MLSARTVVAFFLSPLIVPAALLGLVAATGGLSDTGAQMYIIVSGVAAYIGTIIVGIPALALAGKYVHINLLSLAIIGIISGIVYFQGITYLFAYGFSSTHEMDVPTTATGGVFGLLVAIVFGLIRGQSSVSNKDT